MSHRTLSPWRVLALLLMAFPILTSLASPVSAADPDIPADATRVCESCELSDLRAAVDAAADGDEEKAPSSGADVVSLDSFRKNK